MDKDEFIKLERRVTEYRPSNPHIWTALYISVCIGSISSIVRGYYGWSYEEAGIWLNLCFWGGYGLADLVLGPLALRALYKDWRFSKDVQKLKEQKVLREMP